MMILSVIVISIVGTLLHFLYDITKHNKYVALFAAVNESTWEHIKIALTPTILWSLVDGYMFGINGNYFIAKAVSLLAIIIVIPLLFYGYTSITKKAILPIDIITFYITIIISQVSFYMILNLNTLEFILSYISVIILFIIFGFYMVATLMPIKNFIFKDPITNKYGIKGHSEIEHTKEGK